MSDYLEQRTAASRRRLAQGNLTAYERKVLEDAIAREAREEEQYDRWWNGDYRYGHDEGEPQTDADYERN